MFDFSNQFVGRFAFIHLGAGAAVHRQRGNPGLFGHFGDGKDIFMLVIPAQTGFQGNGNVHRLHHRAQNTVNQIFVLQQGATGQHIADFFGRTAHIDVDNLGTGGDVVAGGFGQLIGIAAGNLHRDRAGFAAVVAAAQGFAGMPQRRIVGNHFADGITGTVCPRQAAERFVGNTGHRRERNRGINAVVADVHHRSGVCLDGVI